jgi:glucokinase
VTRQEPKRGYLVLAGDIGGTKTWLRLAEASHGVLRTVREQRFESAEFDGLVPMIGALLGSESTPAEISSACFGVAGPVEGRRATLTNLPWLVDADEIGQRCGIAAVRLINDFEAIGYGIEALEDHDIATLQIGRPVAKGPRAVLGAGTGLGVCLIVPDGERYRVIATEGGHVDFAPTDELQMGLLRFLQGRFGHVSYERILSGPGLVNIYEFLQDAGAQQPAAELASALHTDGAAAAISQAALGGHDSCARAALQLFIAIYGAQAGNLALTALARGGVYLAGGIAPKVIEELKAGDFMRAFCDKGRFAALLSTIPVHVVMNPQVGLMGAALVASRQ